MCSSDLCGAVVMRIVFRNARDGNTDAPPFIRYVGSMTWGDRPLDATLTLVAEKLHLSALPKSGSMLTRRTMPVFLATYKKAGPATCAPPVS